MFQYVVCSKFYPVCAVLSNKRYAFLACLLITVCPEVIKLYFILNLAEHSFGKLTIWCTTRYRSVVYDNGCDTCLLSKKHLQ